MKLKEKKYRNNYDEYYSHRKSGKYLRDVFPKNVSLKSSKEIFHIKFG
jgi:hypothetical protein